MAPLLAVAVLVEVAALVEAATLVEAAVLVNAAALAEATGYGSTGFLRCRHDWRIPFGSEGDGASWPRNKTTTAAGMAADSRAHASNYGVGSSTCDLTRRQRRVGKTRNL